MNAVVVTFPGSNCDYDIYRASKDVMGADARYVWHRERGLGDPDIVFIPGGFSYGDYLRAGAIARFSPIMEEVIGFAARGGLVAGICNGFQILCESHMLPGALIRNDVLKFRSRWIHMRVENTDTPYTSAYTKGEVLRIPIAHGEGNYVADAGTLEELEKRGQVVFRYCDADGNVTPESNPNGSTANIAGIVNEGRNVIGLMPHPERAVEAVLGGTDGIGLFDSLRNAVVGTG
ncbi:MAG TPA: phosphoribosylformylglycinamidine synthase subunit PurQ [Longimicrobiales bacterium]